MLGPNTIRIEGTVVEVLPGKEKNLYRVELPNGHRVLGFPRRRTERFLQLAVGETVTLEMSPCDFSKGRIAGSEKKV